MVMARSIRPNCSINPATSRLIDPRSPLNQAFAEKVGVCRFGSISTWSSGSPGNNSDSGDTPRAAAITSSSATSRLCLRPVS